MLVRRLANTTAVSVDSHSWAMHRKVHRNTNIKTMPCSLACTAMLSCHLCRSRSHWHNRVVSPYIVGHHGSRGGRPHVSVQHVPGSMVCTVWPAKPVPAVPPYPGPAGGGGPAACGCFPQSRCAPFILQSLRPLCRQLKTALMGQL